MALCSSRSGRPDYSGARGATGSLALFALVGSADGSSRGGWGGSGGPCRALVALAVVRLGCGFGDDGAVLFGLGHGLFAARGSVRELKKADWRALPTGKSLVFRIGDRPLVCQIGNSTCTNKSAHQARENHTAQSSHDSSPCVMNDRGKSRRTLRGAGAMRYPKNAFGHPV